MTPDEMLFLRYRRYSRLQQRRDEQTRLGMIGGNRKVVELEPVATIDTAKCREVSSDQSVAMFEGFLVDFVRRRRRKKEIKILLRSIWLRAMTLENASERAGLKLQNARSIDYRFRIFLNGDLPLCPDT